MRTTLILLLTIAALAGQDLIGDAAAPNLVLPQRHVMHWHPVPLPTPLPVPLPAVEISRVEASVRIVDRVATTTVDVHLRNPAAVQQEAEILLPVPSGSVVIGLDFEGAGAEPSARLLPREEALRLYRQIVARLKDPALMEFIDSACIRSSVFPVPARGEQALRLVYEQHLERDGNRFDYVLPRSMHLAATVPWSISVELRSSETIASVYSPSHRLNTRTRADASMQLQLVPGAEREPGSFRVSWLLGSAPVEASLLAYPDTVHGGGWFLLLAGAPETDPGQRPAIRRELSIVLDRSGSMNGGKMEQARAAALQVIAGLDPDEAFNLFCYHHWFERFAPEPVLKTPANEQAARDWLAAMLPRGGTNIHDALHAALAQPVREGMLPVVLFLTDGIATVGPTGEAEIRAMAKTHNPHARRIFSFGVGEDVNTHLLEKLADDSRASAAFVLPGEDIELATAATFDRLRGPVLRDLELRTLAAGAPAHGRLLDLTPTRLGDVFAGEELLLLGRYTTGRPLQLVLSGRGVDGAYATEVTLDPAAASTLHGHVPRLWASRRIAHLVDAIRELGMHGSAASYQHDPRYRELVDEIVRLSTEFGVLTEYTAFLAEAGTALAPAAALDATGRVMRERAFGQRSGRGSVAQSLNAAQRKTASTVNLGNRYLDAELQEVDAGAMIQPQAASAWYKRGARWVEGSLLHDEPQQRHERRIAFASDAYFALAGRLVAEQRQGSLALGGEILIRIDGELVLVEAP